MGVLRPLIIASDVHLRHGGSHDTAQALSRMIELHPKHEVVLSGDIFNLSCDEPARDPIESVLHMLEPHHELRQALRNHLAAGAPVTLLAGNHDAATMRPELRPALLARLELDLGAPFENLPWFIRRGGVHVEHGHVYDPDNAPTHPLWYGGPETEPLGVALTRRFLAPNDAFDFAHEHETTPVAGLTKAFRLFGVGTPKIIYNYFKTAAELCWEAANDRGVSESRRQGEALLPESAERIDVSEDVLRALLRGLPRPTHHNPRDTFYRLYFDRVIASLSSLTGIGAGTLLRSRSALLLGILAAGYLFGSVRKTPNRYAELPVERLREAARGVRQITRAELVVFGHVHVEDSLPGYVNSASFTYYETPGRPFIHIDETGSFERRRIPL
ncbi:MAG TPA: metallophosphoesterase [Polyangiaceae bacterium]|nr:metallophosphoesterase [Polyangiaceae bacterium]